MIIMSIKNEKTINSYEKYAKEYVNQKNADSNDDVIKQKHAMLSNCLKGVPKSGRLFEIGSGSGEDAAYIQSLGYSNLTVSDAADSFINILRKKGFSPIKFNLLKDDFPEKYDFIHCWAVLMHFTKKEAGESIKKIYNALIDGGKVLFCVKTSKDKAEGWKRLSEKDGEIYFSFWSKDELELFLNQVGFKKIEIWGYGDWIDCLAER